MQSGEVNGDAYLMMTYLEEGASGSQRQLGQLVAQLHSQQQEEGKFGFSLPYEGGDISFDNHWQDDWCTIFVDKRLDHLKDELLNRGYGMPTISKYMTKCDVKLWRN